MDQKNAATATGNPCGFKLGPMDILGHSGQPIQDVRFVDFLVGYTWKMLIFLRMRVGFLRKYMKGGGVVKSEVLLMVQNSGERTT